MHITITKVKHGYLEYSAIYKGQLYRMLYDTKVPKKTFKEYVLNTSHKLGYYQ